MEILLFRNNPSRFFFIISIIIHSKSPPPLFSQPPPSHQSNKGGEKNSFQVVIRNRDKFPQRTHLMNPECLQRATMWIAGQSMSTNIAT
jgi:hypothetical protein